MAKNSIPEYDSTASNNTDIGGTSTLGTQQGSKLDDIVRTLMAHLKDFQLAATFGTDGKDLSLTGTDYAGFGKVASTGYAIGRNDNDGYLDVQGGNDANGGKYRMYGAGHASQARDIEYYSNNTVVYRFDYSAGWHFMNADIVFGQETTALPGISNNTQGAGYRKADGVWAFSVNSNAVFINRTNDGGVLLFSSGGTARGSVSISGATTTYNTTSDAREKEDFKSFDAGPIIDALEAGKFTWKVDGKIGYGVLAQDADKVFPQAITYDAERDRWSADYSKYVPLLLAEIKELRKRLAAVEATPQR